MKVASAAIVATIVASAGPLWHLSSVSGYAGAPADPTRLELALSSVELHRGCADLLARWYDADVRRQVAMPGPTEPLFSHAARRALSDYAAAECPTSGFMVTHEASRREAASKRSAAGLRSFIGTWENRR